MHTKSYGKFGDVTINIDKLINILKDRPNRQVGLQDLDLSSIDIRKQSGFSEKRYTECNIDVPLIIDEKLYVIDGRHRILKGIFFNKKRFICKVATRLDILNCVIK